MIDRPKLEALASRLLDHAKEKPEGSLMTADLNEASALLLSVLDTYEWTCVLVASMNDAARGQYTGEVVGPLENVMKVRKDADRYQWMRRNITRLTLDTERHYHEDGGKTVSVTGLMLNPNFSLNANPEVLDKLVDAACLDGDDNDGKGTVREVLQQEPGRQATLHRVV